MQEQDSDEEEEDKTNSKLVKHLEDKKIEPISVPPAETEGTGDLLKGKPGKDDEDEQDKILQDDREDEDIINHNKSAHQQLLASNQQSEAKRNLEELANRIKSSREKSPGHPLGKSLS